MAGDAHAGGQPCTGPNTARGDGGAQSALVKPCLCTRTPAQGCAQVNVLIGEHLRMHITSTQSARREVGTHMPAGWAFALKHWAVMRVFHRLQRDKRYGSGHGPTSVPSSILQCGSCSPAGPKAADTNQLGGIAEAGPGIRVHLCIPLAR